MSTGYLVLENGAVFRGRRFGAPGTVTAEVVFATGMTGYLETLTDPSYHGQMVAQTFPLIGNYGVISADFESGSIGPAAYLVKHWCQEPSNFRSEGDLDAFLRERSIPGLCEIDTRSLTKTIRESGVMNGILTDDPDTVDFESLRAYRVAGAVGAVSTRQPYTVEPEGEVRYRIALLDFGLKRNIFRELARRGAQVIVLPCTATAADVRNLAVDGIMLSNGPGDPAENVQIIENLKEICKLQIPIFGICLGHQLLALAHGFRTEKLKYGHRGANQPVKNLETGRVTITSQNHGYAVVGDSVDSALARELFVNVNDGTNEGLRYRDCAAFTTQFHPEACAGPLDTRELFDAFFAMIDERRG